MSLSEDAACQEAPLISAPRPMLHAKRLVVDEVEANVSPPADFEAVLAGLAD